MSWRTPRQHERSMSDGVAKRASETGITAHRPKRPSSRQHGAGRALKMGSLRVPSERCSVDALEHYARLHGVEVVEPARLRMIRTIMSGGEATVYEARDSATGELVAAKVYTDTGESVADFCRRVRVARVVAKRSRRISSRNVVRTVGAPMCVRWLEPPDGDDPYSASARDTRRPRPPQAFLRLVTLLELLNGVDMYEYRTMLASARALPLTWSDFVGVACNIIDGVHAMHGAGVAHRDIKVENIVLLSGAEGSETSSPVSSAASVSDDVKDVARHAVIVDTDMCVSYSQMRRERRYATAAAADARGSSPSSASMHQRSGPRFEGTIDDASPEQLIAHFGGRAERAATDLGVDASGRFAAYRRADRYCVGSTLCSIATGLPTCALFRVRDTERAGRDAWFLRVARDSRDRRQSPVSEAAVRAAICGAATGRRAITSCARDHADVLWSVVESLTRWPPRSRASLAAVRRFLLESEDSA